MVRRKSEKPGTRCAQGFNGNNGGLMTTSLWRAIPIPLVHAEIMKQNWRRFFYNLVRRQ